MNPSSSIAGPMPGPPGTNNTSRGGASPKARSGHQEQALFGTYRLPGGGQQENGGVGQAGKHLVRSRQIQLGEPGKQYHANRAVAVHKKVDIRVET
jgi:hypothetical protein